MNTYPSQPINFKAGQFNINNGDHLISITDAYTLADMQYHFFIPLLVIALFAGFQKWNAAEFFGSNNFLKIKNLVYTSVSILILYLLSTYLPMENAEGNEFASRLISDNSIFSLLIIVGILIPIIEEVFFRRLIYDLFNLSVSTFAPWIGIICSALLFTALHSQYSGIALVITLVLALLLSIGRWYSKGILVPIIIHAINNTMGILSY